MKSQLGTGARVAAVLAMLLGLTACTGGEDDDDGRPGSSASTGSEEAGVSTQTTVRNVSGSLDKTHRVKVKDGVNEVIDPFFDGAYLGDFPRTDYTAAFAGFTDGAQADAQRDLALLSNQQIADQIESATATNRRVRLDVFAPDGRPRGATAHFVLDFTTTGEVDGSHRVLGALFLSREKGVWRIFGYDVDQAAQR